MVSGDTPERPVIDSIKVTNAFYMACLWGGGNIFAITRLGPISKFNFRQCFWSLLHVYQLMIWRGGAYLIIL